MQKSHSLKDSIIPAIIVGAVLPVVVYIALLFLTKLETPIATVYLAILSDLAIMPTLVTLIGWSYVFRNKLKLLGAILGITASIFIVLFYLDGPAIELSGSTTIIRNNSEWGSVDLFSVIIVISVLSGVASIVYWSIVSRMTKDASIEINL